MFEEQGTNYITESDLAKVITTGMSQDMLFKTLGSAPITNEVDSDTVRYDYLFQYKSLPGPIRSVVSGVTVYVKDDRVLRWAPAYGSVGGYREGDEEIPVLARGHEARQPIAISELTFWVVSNRPVDGWHYVDTERLPKLGYVSKDPDLKISRLQSLSQTREISLNERNEEIENPVLGIALAGDDVIAFKRFTEQNRGKRVLIMVGPTEVMAPTLWYVITDGRLRLVWKDSHGFDEIRDKLASLLR